MKIRLALLAVMLMSLSDSQAASVDDDTATALKLLKLTIECSQPPKMQQTKEGPRKILMQYTDASDETFLRFSSLTKFIDPANKADPYERTMTWRVDWKSVDSASIADDGVDLSCAPDVNCVKWHVQIFRDYGTNMERKNWKVTTCNAESAQNMLAAIQTLIEKAKK